MSTDNIYWSQYENQQSIQRWKDKDKAGLIPFYREEDGTIKFLMMVASNPQFGGYKPMISKGSVEDDEQVQECAIREAVEELGLVVENCIGTPFKIFENYVIDEHRRRKLGQSTIEANLKAIHHDQLSYENFRI